MKKLYTININIYNDFGDLVDTQLKFESLDEMRNVDLSKLVDKAETFAKEEGYLYEEYNEYDSSDEYIEDLSPTSPLNNPANFAN